MGFCKTHIISNTVMFAFLLPGIILRYIAMVFFTVRTYIKERPDLVELSQIEYYDRIEDECDAWLPEPVLEFIDLAFWLWIFITIH